MAWLRSMGNAIKSFLITFTKTGYSASVTGGVLSGSTPSPVNYGSAFYPTGVPQTVCTFVAGQGFTFSGTLSEEALGNTITQYISLQVYCDNVLIGETGQVTTPGDKTISVSVPAGQIDVKIDNWRGLGGGNALCSFNAY